MRFKEVAATSLTPSEPNARDILHRLERAALENSLAWPHPAPPNPRSVGPYAAGDRCAIQRFQKGEQLTLDPQLCWQIEVGCVKSMTWDEAGDVVCLGLWGEGDVVGAPLTQLAPYQLECLSAVQARSVLVSGNYSQQNYLQQLISHHSRQIESLLNIVHCRRISDRLMKALTWLVQKFGKRTSDGWLLDFWLTHQTLAEMTGTTRVTVTRLLHELEREGQIIRQSRHRILLCRLG